MAEPGLRRAGTPPVAFIDAGRGRPVMLLHASASGPTQWQALIAALTPARRVIAPALLGYGGTAPRDAATRASAAGQATAMAEALAGLEGPVDIVGHSFGAVVALALAAALGPRAGRLVLFEPNAFALLDRPGHADDWDWVRHTRARLDLLARRGAAAAQAALLADFLIGPGAFAAMPAERRAALATALRHNPEEWAAVMPPALDPAPWQGIAGPVLLISAQDSPAPLGAVAGVLRSLHPDWHFAELDRGGHLAPITRPRDFNAAVLRFLAAG
jgi:pimeloyl-ACP methyl ester carboxylesterase